MLFRSGCFELTVFDSAAGYCRLASETLLLTLVQSAEAQPISTPPIRRSQSPIKLAFTQGEVALEAGAGDEANSSESLDAVLEGDDITVSFNPAFLLDGLRAIDTRYAQLSFTVPGKPAVLMGRPALDAPPQEEFRYLMMPLRVPGQSAG